MMKETETMIIHGLRKQDPKAQQQLLELYGDYVWASVVRLVPDVSDAEEVYQDVFIKVFRNIDMYDEQKAALKTWIARIAYNESISALRRKRQPTVYFEDYRDEAETLSEAEVNETLGQANQETVQQIRAAIKLLPPDEQAIITMFYYDEMSLKEIAFATDSIPTTIASKLSRIRKKLCKIINTQQSCERTTIKNYG